MHDNNKSLAFFISTWFICMPSRDFIMKRKTDVEWIYPIHSHLYCFPTSKFTCIFYISFFHFFLFLFFFILFCFCVSATLINQTEGRRRNEKEKKCWTIGTQSFFTIFGKIHWSFYFKLRKYRIRFTVYGIRCTFYAHFPINSGCVRNKHEV